MEHNIRLKTGLQSLGCSALAFSALAAPPLVTRKVSQQVISQIITGAKEFDSIKEAQEFIGVVETMEHLQQTVQPRVPINWTNVLELKDVLAQAHEQKLNDEDPVTVQHFYLRLTHLNFFRRINDHGIDVTINPEKDAAAFSDLALAQQAISELKKRGVHAQWEKLTGPRRKSTLVTSLEQIGFASVVVDQ